MPILKKLENVSEMFNEEYKDRIIMIHGENVSEDNDGYHPMTIILKNCKYGKTTMNATAIIKWWNCCKEKYVIRPNEYLSLHLGDGYPFFCLEYADQYDRKYFQYVENDEYGEGDYSHYPFKWGNIYVLG